MTDQVAQALAQWGLEAADCAFVAGRENRVYRVRAASGDFALRLKRPGYRSDEELLSELQWLDAMAKAGLQVPRPEPSLRGALLEKVADLRVDLLHWLPGRPLGRTGEPLQLENAVGTFRGLGHEMACLHDACDAWTKPAGFTRRAWDFEGLLGEAPLWGRFWENPTLDAKTRKLFADFRAVARNELSRCGHRLDRGLIHADLVRENVLLGGAHIALLDFDDGGWGYRLFDVATALLKNRAEPRYGDLAAALLAGYRERRALDVEMLDLFLALRAATYVGWIVPRLGEDEAKARNRRYVETASELCARYMRAIPIS